MSKGIFSNLSNNYFNSKIDSKYFDNCLKKVVKEVRKERKKRVKYIVPNKLYYLISNLINNKTAFQVVFFFFVVGEGDQK